MNLTIPWPFVALGALAALTVTWVIVLILGVRLRTRVLTRAELQEAVAAALRSEEPSAHIERLSEKLGRVNERLAPIEERLVDMDSRVQRLRGLLKLLDRSSTQIGAALAMVGVVFGLLGSFFTEWVTKSSGVWFFQAWGPDSPQVIWRATQWAVILAVLVGGVIAVLVSLIAKRLGGAR